MQSLDHIKLRDTPFRMGVTPSEIIAHTSWCEAKDGALAALADGVLRIALIGHTGSGRTLLLNTLANALTDQGRTVRLAGGGRLPVDIDDEAVLLLDDADRLDKDAITRCIKRSAPCIFAGPPVIRAMIPPPFTLVKLKPLSPDEVARFVAMRLAAAGRRRDFMQPDAVLALARVSGGVPRQINVLGGSAVFLAELDGASAVSQHHVEEAALMRDGGDALPPPVADEEVDEPQPASKLPLAAPPPPQPMTVTRPPARRARFASRLALAATVIAAALLIAAAISSHPWIRPSQPQKVAAAPPTPAAAPQQQNAAPAPEPTPPARSIQQSAPLTAPPAPALAQAQPSTPPPEPQPAAPAPVPAGQSPAAPAAPVMPQEATRAPEPQTAPSRIVLHYRAGDGREADHLATWLTQLDSRFGNIETRQVPSTPRTPAIRFYYPEDVGAAWALRAALSNTGETWQVSNYTRYQPKPRRGTLEVWLP